MRLRCTVARPDGTSTDLEVRAPPSTPATDVARAVAAAAATDAGRLRVSGRALDDHLPVGLPPLVHGAVLTVAPEGRPAPGSCGPDSPARQSDRRRAGLLEVRVVGGPDSGATHRVAPGTHRVGRAPGCEVRVEDAACSRVHAVLDIAEDGVSVRDAGSTNGTSIDGVPVDASSDDAPTSDGATRPGTPLPVGARLRVGDTTLQVHPVTDDPAPLRRCGDGTLALRRSARRRPPATDRVVPVPEPPSEPPRSRVPWVGAALPLLVSVPLALLVGAGRAADRPDGAARGARQRLARPTGRPSRPPSKLSPTTRQPRQRPTSAWRQRCATSWRSGTTPPRTRRSWAAAPRTGDGVRGSAVEATTTCSCSASGRGASRRPRDVIPPMRPTEHRCSTTPR